jgi:hypothetical protein
LSENDEKFTLARYSCPILMKNGKVGAEPFPAGGRAGGHMTKKIVAFRNFVNASKKYAVGFRNLPHPNSLQLFVGVELMLT